MHLRFSRRSLIALPVVLADIQPLNPAADSLPSWVGAPIGWPDRPPGEGFQIGHGFACENSWFTPGWWHTGEDWYAVDGDTAGAEIRTIAGGEVVYVGFDYPGRVVIVQHASDLYSMYGHLNHDAVVAAGQIVDTGDILGTVLQQADRRGPGKAPSHLHFEMRRFLIRDDVNGTQPSYGVNCGYQCPPGPGYWPMSASELAVDLGWLNPTHQRFELAQEHGLDGLAIRAVLEGIDLALRAEPNPRADQVDSTTPDLIADLPLLEVLVGDPSGREHSAEGYTLWFLVAPLGSDPGWIQAAIPSFRETGRDGRPSSIDVPFIIVPA